MNSLPLSTWMTLGVKGSWAKMWSRAWQVASAPRFQAGAQALPLGGGVGDVHDPEEAFAHVSPAEGDGVDLKHAGLTGLVKSARPCGDFGGEGCFAAGTFVRLVGRQAVRSDDARDGGDAHAAQFVCDGLRDRRFRLRVIPDGCIHDSVEIERTHLPHRQPDTDEGSPGLLGIGWGPASMGVVTIGRISPFASVQFTMTHHGNGEGDFVV